MSKNSFSQPLERTKNETTVKSQALKSNKTIPKKKSKTTWTSLKI